MPTQSSHAPWNKLRESPRDWRTVRWLRKKPVPALVVGTDEDGEEIRVKLVGKVGERPHWADATRALHDCEKLVAHDDDGNILRTLEHDDDDPELRAEAQREEARRGGGEVVGSALLAIDVPRLVKEIAESMKDVANSTAEHQSNAHAEAFKQMGNVLTIAMNLLARLDEKIDELSNAPQQLAAPENSRDQMAQQLLGQMMAGGGVPALPGAGGGGGLDLGAILKKIPPAQLQEWFSLLQGDAGGEPAGDDDAPNGAANGRH